MVSLNAKDGGVEGKVQAYSIPVMSGIRSGAICGRLKHWTGECIQILLLEF